MIIIKIIFTVLKWMAQLAQNIRTVNSIDAMNSLPNSGERE